MSMNVRFGTDTCHCSAIKQTPTKATYEIVESDDPMDAYFVWLRKMWEPILAEGNDPEFWQQDLDRQLQAIRDYGTAHPNAEWTAD